MTDALFVYGSLRSEFDNQYAVALRAEADLTGSATVRGSIFPADQYPGYRPEPDGLVHGEVWRLRDFEKTIAMLDEYEGSMYRRVLVATSICQAWIYEYTGPVR